MHCSRSPSFVWVWALLAITLFGGSGCINPKWVVSAPQRTRLSADRIELPTKMISGLPTVEVSVNGRGPYLFLVDTGAWGVEIAAEVVRATGIQRDPNRVWQRVGLAGDKKTTWSAMVDRMEAPGFKLEQVVVPILDDADSQIFQTLFGERFGGILGLLAFYDALLEIDYPAQKVTVARRGSYVWKKENTVAFEGRIPLVRVDAAGRPLSMVIDTGSTETIALPKLEDWPLCFPPVKGDGFVAFGGARRELDSQLDGVVRLGPLTLRNPPVNQSTLKDLPEAGVVGSKGLGSSRLVIDPRGKRLEIFSPQSEISWAKIAEAPPTFGAFVAVEGARRVVREVDAGGVAEKAGLRVGDVLLAEDGETASNALRRRDAQGRARLTVLRGEQKLEITFDFSRAPLKSEPPSQK